MWTILFAASAFKHKLSRVDYYDCLENPDRLVKKSRDDSYELIASNRHGDLFHIAFRKKTTQRVIVVFHGRPANLKEKRRYRWRGK